MNMIYLKTRWDHFETFFKQKVIFSLQFFYENIKTQLDYELLLVPASVVNEWDNLTAPTTYRRGPFDENLMNPLRDDDDTQYYTGRGVVTS